MARSTTRRNRKHRKNNKPSKQGSKPRYVENKRRKLGIKLYTVLSLLMTRLSTVLSLIVTLLFVIYHLRGYNFLPETVLLPVAGQVLSVGIHALSTMIFASLTRFATHRELPLDVLTPFLINVDTQLGGFLTPERILLAPFVNLLMLHTPETLLGTLAAGKPDIRPLRSEQQQIELGPFGGAFNNSIYYLSGQLLLSTTNPDVAYRQVAYRTDLGWIVPRKPTVWYEVYAQTLWRDNDAEKRIVVPENDAVILVPVLKLPPSCNQKTLTDFWFSLTMHHCESFIGFSFGGYRLPHTQAFYQFYRGRVSARYASSKGERFVDGDSPTGEMVATPFPRVDDFWNDMKYCFLNAASFNRPPAKIPVTDQLTISSVVRIAGLDNFSGFSTPPATAEASVTDVSNTNISRWVLVTMGFAVLIDIVRVVLSRFKFELLAPELEALVASLRDVRGMRSVGRFAGGKKWFHRVWGSFERDEDGGGRWVIPDGLDGEAKEGEAKDGEAKEGEAKESEAKDDEEENSDTDTQTV